MTNISFSDIRTRPKEGFGSLIPRESRLIDTTVEDGGTVSIPIHCDRWTFLDQGGLVDFLLASCGHPESSLVMMRVWADRVTLDRHAHPQEEHVEPLVGKMTDLESSTVFEKYHRWVIPPAAWHSAEFTRGVYALTFTPPLREITFTQNEEEWNGSTT